LWLKILDTYKTLWDDLISNYDIIQFPIGNPEELILQKDFSTELNLVFESVEEWEGTRLTVNLLEVSMDWKTGHYTKDWSETKDLATWKFQLSKKEDDANPEPQTEGDTPEIPIDLQLIFRHRPI
jgi:hypothetical protein